MVEKVMAGLMLLAISSCTYYCYTHESVCLEKATVTVVGGCGSGTCGVLLSNGERRDSYRPVVGDVICVKSEMRESK